MKLIDGHAMIQRVEALHKRGTVDLSYYNIVKEAVQMEPSVDAAPVMHGKWNYIEMYEGHAMGECSNCLKFRIVDNFCPNCGARMDGDRNADD